MHVESGSGARWPHTDDCHCGRSAGCAAMGAAATASACKMRAAAGALVCRAPRPSTSTVCTRHGVGCLLLGTPRGTLLAAPEPHPMPADSMNRPPGSTGEPRRRADGSFRGAFCGAVPVRAAHYGEHSSKPEAAPTAVYAGRQRRAPPGGRFPPALPHAARPRSTAARVPTKCQPPRAMLQCRTLASGGRTGPWSVAAALAAALRRRRERTVAGCRAVCKIPHTAPPPAAAPPLQGFIGLSMWGGTLVRVWNQLSLIDNLQSIAAMTASAPGPCGGRAGRSERQQAQAPREAKTGLQERLPRPADACSVPAAGGLAARPLAPACAPACCPRPTRRLAPRRPAVFVLVVAWPTWARASYMRWRVPALAFLRVFLIALPFNFKARRGWAAGLSERGAGDPPRPRGAALCPAPAPSPRAAGRGVWRGRALDARHDITQPRAMHARSPAGGGV